MTGWFSVNGTPESGPTRCGIPLVDMGTGLFAAVAVLMALEERHRSGLGQFVDMTLFDTGVALMHPHIPNYLLSGKTPGLTGERAPEHQPVRHVPAPGRWRSSSPSATTARSSASARSWGDPGWRDPRFLHNADRLANRAELHRRARGASRRRGWRRSLRAPARDRRARRADPRRRPASWSIRIPSHRELLAELDGYQGPGIPIKLSRTRASVHRPPPSFGAQGREILAESGFSTDEIEGLVKSGAVVEERRRA